MSKLFILSNTVIYIIILHHTFFVNNKQKIYLKYHTDIDQ